MTAYGANHFIIPFSIIAIGAVLLYVAYAVIDRMGLEVRSADATVVSKQYNPPGTTYSTNITGGRAWTQSQQTPESYVVILQIDGEQTVGLVSKQLFESLNAGDKVKAKVRRTRITRRLEAFDVSR
jgi:hypothetical protein